MGPNAGVPPDSAGMASSPNWFSRLALPLILLIAILLAVSFLNNYQNWGDDWAEYILQAKAILDHSIAECIQQSSFMVRESAAEPGPVAYPWGLPVLLAAEGSVGPFNLHTFKLFNILILVLLVVSIYRLARRFLGNPQALAVASMFAFNPGFLHYCNHVLSELPFILASVCAFLVIENRNADGSSSARSQLLTGALAFAAFTFRSNGILILAAATVREFLHLSREKVWTRPALRTLVLPYVSFFLLNVAWGLLFSGAGTGYFRVFQAFSTQTLITNVLNYPVSLFDFFTAGRHTGIIAAVLWPLVLWGAFKTWRRTAHLSTYGLMTLVLYFVWPEGQGYRFMMPITPFLVILMVLGLEEIVHWKTAGKFGAIAARSVQYGWPVLFLLASSLLVATGRVPQEIWNPYDQSSSEMFQWIKNNTPGDAVISFFKPRAMHLLADRLCLTAMPADLGKAAYLVYTKQRAWNEAEPTMEQYQQAALLTPAFENRNFVVYRVAARP